MPNSYCIALQPICDHEMRHIADELLYRSSANAQHADFSDGVLATARASHIAFYEIGLEKLVGRRQLFINAPRNWLLNPELLPPHSSQVVLEVLEDVVAEPKILQALSRLRQQGYQIALDDFMLSEATRLLVSYADYVKIDRWQTITLEEIAYYKHHKIKIIAEKVETHSDFELLVKKGFDYFQGYFYAKPQIKTESAHERLFNRQALMRLLAQLQHEFVDYEELKQLILLDPHLTYVILKHTNSAFYALHQPVTSIQTAIQVLGLRRLRALVASQLFSAKHTNTELLLAPILTFAAMCENLAGLYGINGHLAFVVGLLSKVHVVFGDSYGELLIHLSLPEDVIDQLEARQGHYGRLLGLVESFENSDVSRLSEDEVALLNEVWVESRVWVQDVLAHIDQG